MLLLHSYSAMQQVERLVWYLILGMGSPTLCPSMRGLLSLTPSCGRMWQGGTSQGTYSCFCGGRATSSKHPPSLRLSDRWKRWANWLVKFPETLLFGSSSSAESLPCHVAAAERCKMNCTHLWNERLCCLFHVPFHCSHPQEQIDNETVSYKLPDGATIQVGSSLLPTLSLVLETLHTGGREGLELVAIILVLYWLIISCTSGSQYWAFTPTSFLEILGWRPGCWLPHNITCKKTNMLLWQS